MGIGEIIDWLNDHPGWHPIREIFKNVSYHRAGDTGKRISKWPGIKVRKSVIDGRNEYKSNGRA